MSLAKIIQKTQKEISWDIKWENQVFKQQHEQ